jgi:hypothetical protein
MNLNRYFLAAALVLGLCFVSGAYGFPAQSGKNPHSHAFEDQNDPNQKHPESPMKSVTGKVVAVSDKLLTLEVQSGGASDPMDFVIDGNTKTDNPVQPGSTVSVDYRTDEGKNYALHIMPAPPANTPPQPVPKPQSN